MIFIFQLLDIAWLIYFLDHIFLLSTWLYLLDQTNLLICMLFWQLPWRFYNNYSVFYHVIVWDYSDGQYSGKDLVYDLWFRVIVTLCVDNTNTLFNIKKIVTLSNLKRIVSQSKKNETSLHYDWTWQEAKLFFSVWEIAIMI